MKKHIYIGMDVHKEKNVIAIAEGGRNGEIREYGSITNDLRSLERLIKRLEKAHPKAKLHFVYEAGPCGFVIYRKMKKMKLDCVVVAPSSVPKRPGERVKTDRRDAIKLARLHRAGELTAITVPDPADEAIRDLCRSRTDARKAVNAWKQRLKSFLLRNGYRYKGEASWGDKHMSYLRELVMPHPSHKVILEEYLMAIDEGLERKARLSDHIQALTVNWRWMPVVKALMCMRGIEWLTATVLVSELGELGRFTHPRKLMAYLGLVSSENTSGTRRRQGSITKAGNTHARYFLVESAQHCGKPPKVSRILTARQQGHSLEIRKKAWDAQLRLNKRYWALINRGVLRNKALVAVAREMVGFIWEIYQMVEPWPKKKAP